MLQLTQAIESKSAEVIVTATETDRQNFNLAMAKFDSTQPAFKDLAEAINLGRNDIAKAVDSLKKEVRKIYDKTSNGFIQPTARISAALTC